MQPDVKPAPWIRRLVHPLISGGGFLRKSFCSLRFNLVNTLSRQDRGEQSRGKGWVNYLDIGVTDGGTGSIIAAALNEISAMNAPFEIFRDVFSVRFQQTTARSCKTH